jgi:hypothetical protein
MIYINSHVLILIFKVISMRRKRYSKYFLESIHLMDNMWYLVELERLNNLFKI